MNICVLVLRLEPLHRFHAPCCEQGDIATNWTAGGCVRVGTTQRLLYSAASDHHCLHEAQPLPRIYIYIMIKKGFYVSSFQTFRSF